MLDDLADFVTADVAADSLEPVALAAVVAEATADLGEQIRASGAAITVALGDLPPSVIGEAESAALAERAAAFEAMGAPAGIARRAAALETLAAAGDLMQAARANGCSIEAATRVHFRLGERLSLAADRGGFDRFTVCALTGPGAGALTLELGAATAAMPLDAPRAGSRCQTVEATGSATSGGRF